MKWIGNNGKWSDVNNWTENRLPEQNDVLEFETEDVIIDCHAVCFEIKGEPEFYGVGDCSLTVNGVKYL